MAYQIKYRLPFNTNAGADIDWRLDIHQEAYTGSIIDMVGSSEPVKLEYVANQDIYNPVVTSKMDIDLIVPDESATRTSYGSTINTDDPISSSLQFNLLLREDDDNADLDTIFFTDANASIGTINEENTTGYVIRDTASDNEFEIPNSTDGTWTYTDSNSRYTITMSGIAFPQWVKDLAFENEPISGNRTDYRVRTSTWTGTGTATTVEVQRKTTTTGSYYDNFAELRDANNNLDPRAYKVYLRYKKAADNDYDTYWVGFITAQDQQTSYTTAPYGISLTATDGFNLIVDRKLEAFDGNDPSDDTYVREYIFNALFETGTQLKIRDYTDIRVTDADDNEQHALTECKVNDYVFTDEDFAPTKNVVDAAKDILTAFNARIFQSRGAWCIISNSNHKIEVADNVNRIPFQLWDYDVASDSWFRDAANEPDGSDAKPYENALFAFPDDATLAYDDAISLFRRPLFSYERSIATQNGIPISTNSFISDAPGSVVGETGVVWRNIGIGAFVEGDVKNYGVTRVAHSLNDDDVRGTHFIRTTRTNNIKNTAGNRDLWVEQNIPLSMFWDNDKVADIIVRQNWSDVAVDKADVGVCLVVEVGSNDDNFWVWNFENSEWDYRDAPKHTAKNRYWTRIESNNDNKNTWQSSSIGANTEEGRNPKTLINIASAFAALRAAVVGGGVGASAGPVGSLVGAASGVLGVSALRRSIIDKLGIDDVDGTIRIRVGDIRAYNSEGNALSDQNIVTTDVDALILSYSVPEWDPHFEAFQPFFSETNSDETSVFSHGPDTYRGSLDYNSYFRDGITEDKFLEEIVLRQKMNDYASALKFYQGTLIPNEDQGPIHLVDKIKNSTDTDSDSNSGIQHYSKVKPKSNEYDSQFYVADQSVDNEAVEYTEDNVFPFENRYTWKVARFGYEYELDFSGVTLPTDDSQIATATSAAASIGDTTLTVDSTSGFAPAGFIVVDEQELFYTAITETTFTITGEGEYSITSAIATAEDVVAGIESYITLDIPKTQSNGIWEPGLWSLTKYGQDGENYVAAVTITPLGDIEIPASGMSVTNAADLIAQNITFQKLGQAVQMTFEFEVDDYLETEQYEMAMDIDPLVGDNTSVFFGATGTQTNCSLAQGVNNVLEIGPVGSTDTFVYDVVPDTGGFNSYELETTNVVVSVTSVNSQDNGNGDPITGIINTGAVDVTKVKVGDAVKVLLSFKYVADDRAYVKVSINATASVKQDLALVTLTIDIDGEGDDWDAGNWSLNKTQQAISGSAGEYFSVPIEVSPDSGRFLQKGTIDVTETTDEITNTYVTFGASETLIWLEGNLPNATPTDNIDVVVDADTITADQADSLRDFKITFSAPTNTTITNQPAAGRTLSLLPGQTSDMMVTLEANSAYQLDSTVVPTVPTGVILEGQVCSGTNGVYEICSYTFNVTGPNEDNISDDNTITWGDGAVEDQDNIYTLRYNIGIDTTGNFDGNLSTTTIDVPFGDADLGEAIGGKSFTVRSARQMMMFGTGDVDVDLPDGYGFTETADSEGVVTITLTGNFPSSIPTTGTTLVNVSVKGETSVEAPATRISITPVFDSVIDRVDSNIPETFTTGFSFDFIIESNGLFSLETNTGDSSREVFDDLGSEDALSAGTYRRSIKFRVDYDDPVVVGAVYINADSTYGILNASPGATYDHTDSLVVSSDKTIFAYRSLYYANESLLQPLVDLLTEQEVEWFISENDNPNN